MIFGSVGNRGLFVGEVNGDLVWAIGMVEEISIDRHVESYWSRFDGPPWYYEYKFPTGRFTLSIEKWGVGFPTEDVWREHMQQNQLQGKQEALPIERRLLKPGDGT